MIESHLKTQRRYGVSRILPRVIAAFSFRYDAHLVPALLENITPYVDGWVSFDDRASSERFSSEPHRRAALIEAAMALGADWIFAVDPDERLEFGAVRRFRLLTLLGKCAWTFNVREMYASDFFRVDGIWGHKRIPRLFPAQPFDPAEVKDFHGHWFAPRRWTFRHSGLELYHLKMINPERRAARAALYKALDPEGLHQSVGYDYLADDTGAQFRKVPERRMYRPAHEDDGGLWMPAL